MFFDFLLDKNVKNIGLSSNFEVRKFHQILTRYKLYLVLNLVQNNVIPSMRKISQVTRLGSTLTPDNTVSINHGKFKSKLKS